MKSNLIPTKAQIDRFWSFVDKQENGCWNWTKRCRDEKDGGKGIYFLKNKGKSYHYQSNRFAWLVTYGKIPEGKSIFLKCDNHKCCNPNHMFCGTHHDKMEELKPKKFSGTHRKTKLSVETVIQILIDFQNGYSYKQISERTGVYYAQIYSICTRRSWAYVDIPNAKEIPHLTIERQ